MLIRKSCREKKNHATILTTIPCFWIAEVEQLAPTESPGLSNRIGFINSQPYFLTHLLESQIYVFFMLYIYIFRKNQHFLKV